MESNEEKKEMERKVREKKEKKYRDHINIFLGIDEEFRMIAK